MIVVIQCAARKRQKAGCLTRGHGMGVCLISSSDQIPPVPNGSHRRNRDRKKTRRVGSANEKGSIAKLTSCGAKSVDGWIGMGRKKIKVGDTF
jgi:hypothetical protein